MYIWNINANIKVGNYDKVSEVTTQKSGKANI